MAEVKGVSITATTVKELKATIDELRGSLIQLSKADENYDTKVRELQAHQAKLNEIMGLTSKASLAQVQAVGAVANSYDQLVAKGAHLRSLWRQVEIGTEEWKKLADEIKENEMRLIAADEAIGRHQRNVGNYVGAVQPLQYQLQQIAREMPSLTVSANQFFLAISNNLPMFADEISKLRQANQELVAQGKPTVNILTQIVKGIFSWQTALVVIITLLTQFGGKIIEWVKTLGKAKVSIDDIVVSINKFAISIETERRELNALFLVLKNAEKGTTQYAIAKKQIQDKYGSYLQNQSIEIRNLADLSKAYEVLEGKINATAIAKAMEGQRSEIIKEYQEAVGEAFDSIGKIFERKFGTELGTQYITALRLGLNSGVPELEEEAQRILNLFDGNDVGKGFYKVNTAVRKANEAYTIYNEKLKGVQAVSEQMSNLLGVTANDVEEVRKTVVETSGAFATFASTEDNAKDIAKQTAQALREIKEEAKATTASLTDFAKEHLQQLKEQQQALDASLRGVKAQESEELRYAQLKANNAEEIYNIQQQALYNEMALLKQGYDEGLFYGEERIKAEERMAQIERDIAYNTAKYQTEKQKEVAQGAVAVATASIQAMGSIFGSIADMYEQNNEQDKKSMQKAKNLRIAGATMDMLGGITAALAGAFTTKTGPWDLILAGIQASTILASGIANIAKIRNTDTSGNSSGGGVGAVVSPPTIVQQVPVTRTLTGVAEEERLNQAQRVYVVYDDIAQVGRKVEVTENEATF